MTPFLAMDQGGIYSLPFKKHLQQYIHKLSIYISILTVYPQIYYNIALYKRINGTLRKKNSILVKSLTKVQCCTILPTTIKKFR
jgi:hypothetical protein